MTAALGASRHCEGLPEAIRLQSFKGIASSAEDGFFAMKEISLATAQILNQVENDGQPHGLLAEAFIKLFTLVAVGLVFWWVF